MHPSENLQTEVTEVQETPEEATKAADEKLEETSSNRLEDHRCIRSFAQDHPSPNMTHTCFPGDEGTGALHAFRSKTSKDQQPVGEVQSNPTQPIQESVEESQHAEGVPQATMLESSEDEGDDIPVPIPRTKQKFPMQTNIEVDPATLLAGGLVICDIDAKQVYRSGAGHTVTMEQVVHAQHEVGCSTNKLVSLLGLPLNMADTVGEITIIIDGDLMCHTYEELTDLEGELQTMDRRVSLLHQGPAVAVDEMVYYLSALSSTLLTPVGMRPLSPAVIDLLGDVQQIAKPWLQTMQSVQNGVSAVLWGHHWIPVVFQLKHGKVVITTTEGSKMWELLCQTDQSYEIQVQPALESQFPYDCGFQAFAWIVSVIAKAGHPLSAKDAAGWRRLFWQTIVMHPGQVDTRLGGQQVRFMLQNRGRH